MSIEELLTQSIEHIFTVKLDISSSGPIQGDFTNVRLTPHVMQLFSDRTHGLHINGEDTRIGQMKIEMDLNQML